MSVSTFNTQLVTVDLENVKEYPPKNTQRLNSVSAELTAIRESKKYTELPFLAFADCTWQGLPIVALFGENVFGKYTNEYALTVLLIVTRNE